MIIQLYTFGCTVNNGESQKMRELFLQGGHRVTEDGVPDAIVVNGCAITSVAENKSLQLVKRLRKKYPDAIIALVGCCVEYALLYGKKAMDEADLHMGNHKLDVVKEILKMAGHTSAAIPFDRPDAKKNPDSRAYIQVQNGCNAMCSYCIVPMLRGTVSRSTPIHHIVSEIKSYVACGVSEVWIAGINLALYKDEDRNIIDALASINAIEGLELIALSSLEPATFTEGFFAGLPGITKLAPHFHIPLQNGCDKTLLNMGRNYTFDQYYDILERLRSVLPDASISTDVIVGFPGESDRDFLASARNIARCRFSDLHIFKYSPRKGTRAEKLPHPVGEHKKNARADLMRGVKMQARSSFLAAYIGTTDWAVLSPADDGRAEGLTSRNEKILIDSPDGVPKGRCKIRINGILPAGAGVFGSILDGE